MSRFKSFSIVFLLGALAGAGLLVPASARDDHKTPIGPGGSKSYPQAVLASKPVGYWRLDEAKGPSAVDAGPHHRAGKYVGPVAFEIPGALKSIADRAVRFDGKSAYAELPADKAFSVPTSGKGLSVEVWMNPSTLEFEGETKDPYVFWLGKGEPGQFEWAFRFYSRKSTRPNRISAYVFNRARRTGDRRLRRGAAQGERMDASRRLLRSGNQGQPEGGRLDLQERSPARQSGDAEGRPLQLIRHRAGSGDRARSARHP